MRDSLGPGTQVGYCTNVHAGASWQEVRDNLERYALAVKSQVCPSDNLGVGLWLSARSARDIIEQQDVARFRDWLDDNGLTAYTFNGFPHGDFHEAIVKHKVYRPSWCAAERVRYTLDLVEILCGLLPEGGEGSISTLPLGWRGDLPNPADLAHAAHNLLGVVDELERRERDTGKLLHLDLEPEPGCALDTVDDVCRFYREHLLSSARGAGQTGSAGEDRVRRYLRICHDVCHAAVMFEDQSKVLQQYRAAGILVGKVQISSALSVRFDRMSPADRQRAAAQLRSFSEERYLHQTVVRHADGTQSFYEDLPDALDSPCGTGGQNARGVWRVHFHVPVFSTGFGLLGTTQGDIIECLRTLRQHHDVRHFEVETYAWNVLPSELRGTDLATGIASELIWLRDDAAVETSA
ncbi:MAG: metabolite traffic protein EboE [Planctomycetes bacterium]|nr:metabolite traffic protein EboE [Planctomycetota bacterium]